MAHSATGGAMVFGSGSAAATTGRNDWRPSGGRLAGHGARSPRRGSLHRLNLDEISDLLERRLAWYGLRSVRLGPFRSGADGALLVDLLDTDGSVLDRVEVDRTSGALRPTRGQATPFWERFSAGPACSR